MIIKYKKLILPKIDNFKFYRKDFLFYILVFHLSYKYNRNNTSINNKFIFSKKSFINNLKLFNIFIVKDDDLIFYFKKLKKEKIIQNFYVYENIISYEVSKKIEEKISFVISNQINYNIININHIKLFNNKHSIIMYIYLYNWYSYKFNNFKRLQFSFTIKELEDLFLIKINNKTHFKLRVLEKIKIDLHKINIDFTYEEIKNGNKIISFLLKIKKI